MSRYDAYPSFRPGSTSRRDRRAPIPRPAKSLRQLALERRPRLDLPDRGARSFVEIERRRRQATTSQVRRSASVQAWELLGWVAAAAVLALAGVGVLALIPGALGPVGTARSGSGGARSPGLAHGAGTRAPAGGPGDVVVLPIQVGAPELVALMVGSLADQWTFEDVAGETTLRVEVARARIGEAFLRASLALRAPSGRRAWDRLGVDRLELRCEEAALSLRVVSHAGP